MTTRVFCTFEFEAIHSWSGAPDSHLYLKHPHRHVFKVQCEVPVNHADREVEFIDLKERIRRSVAAKLNNGVNWSCEQWAQWLTTEHNLARCKVSEDGENGAIVEA